MDSGSLRTFQLLRYDSFMLASREDYDMTMHDGGCACGDVRYSTTSEVRRAVVCHCRYCQTRTGSAFGDE